MHLGEGVRGVALRAVLSLAVVAVGCSRMGDRPPWWPQTEPQAPSESAASTAAFQSDSTIADATYCTIPPPKPPPHPPQVPSEPNQKPEAVQTVVRNHYGEFRRCYERLLAKHPTAEGRVQARFIIAPDGGVTHACITREGTTLDHDAMANCMLEEFAKLRFEPSKGKTTVVYPIMFSPVEPLEKGAR